MGAYSGKIFMLSTRHKCYTRVHAQDLPNRKNCSDKGIDIVKR